jgi:hypothetical protein
MSNIISPEDLDKMCIEAIDVASGLIPHAFDLYTLLYNFGLRYIEAYELNRWEFYEGKNYKVQTAKGGNPRLCDMASIPERYLALIDGETEFYNWCRYSTFTRSFHRTFINYPISHDGKNVTTHIFRYNRIKQLYVQQWDIRQISEWIGEIDERNTQGYIEAVLTFED